MVSSVVNSHRYMSVKFGQEWDESFLINFTQICYVTISCSDLRGQRIEDEYTDIVLFLQFFLVRGGQDLYEFLRGPRNPRGSNCHSYHPKHINLPLPSVNTIRSTIPINSLSRTFKESDLMPILKQLPNFPYVVLSFDSMYIKSTLLFDHQNIDGIEKPVPISDFMKFPSLVLNSGLVKQVYVIIMSSFDNSISVPLVLETILQWNCRIR